MFLYSVYRDLVLMCFKVRKPLFYGLMTTPSLDAESNDSQLDVSTSSTKRYPLSADNLERCTNLMTLTIEYFTPMLFTPPATSHMACTDVFADTWMSHVIQPALEDDGVYKPIETLERIKDIDWGKEGLCASCVEEKKEEWTEEQDKIWHLMDDWLALPPDEVDQ